MTVLEASAEASWSALGTRVHLLVTDSAVLDEATRVANAILDAVDLACSRFRPDSELVLIGGAPGPVTVSRVLGLAVRAALDVVELTQGLVDPTLGEDLVRAGYDRTFAALPIDGPTSVPLPRRPNRWREIDLDGCQLTVPADVRLDLGASAKAWASDAIADAVAVLGGGVLVNLGGDLAARGPAPEGGWAVEVADRPEAKAFTVVAIEEGGLATSSTTARSWRRGGRLHHHILDPRTGLPAPSPWASVSVTAGTCLEANAASTAAVVLGATAPAWLAEHGFPSCLRSTAGEVVRVGGWPS